MSLAGLFISAFIIALSGAMMPGPLLSTTIAESARRGWTAGPLLILGHAFLELLLVIGLAAGLLSFIQKPLVTQVIALLGGAFLLYLGYSMSRQAAAGQLKLDGGGKARSSGLNPVLAGVLVSVSNPYWSIWWATIGLGYLTIALQQGWLGMAAFFSGHILADLAWYAFIAVLIAEGRRFFSQRVYNYILLACGIFLVGMGVFFIYRGLIG
ncbi:MAG: LysE family transporter [Syntrophomonadaceae bacterium]